MSNQPSAPPDVAAAAAKVEAWLQSQTQAAQQPPVRASDAEYAKMTHAQRLDYCRAHGQKQFQPNPSPR